MIERSQEISTTTSESILDPESLVEEALQIMDFFEVKWKEIPSFPKRSDLNPDIVVVQIGKNDEFYINRRILCNHSGYFNYRLEFNRERRCELKVKRECVDPTAFECILNYILYNRPLTCHNITVEVIRTSTYLEVDNVISKIQKIVHNKAETVDNALAKFFLIEQMKSKLESNPSILNPVEKVKAIIQGKRGNLKNSHLEKLSNLAYIRKQMESFFYKSILGQNLDGNLFEQLAMRPHVVVEDAQNLTLRIFNVFKNNLKQAVFVDSDIYLQSLNISWQLCAQFLASRLEEVALGTDYLMLSKTQMVMVLEQDVLGARSEMIVYIAALKWIIFHFKVRKQFARDLFGCVRFSQMTKKEIIALYQPPLLEDMLRMPDINDLIDEALISSPDPSCKHRTLLLKGKPLVLKERSI